MLQAKEKSLRRRRSRQKIQDLLNEFERSKTTVKEFCKQHAISPANFHKWKSRYRSKVDNKNRTSGFAAIDIVSSSQHASYCLFAEVGNIKIYQPVNASFLKELLK